MHVVVWSCLAYTNHPDSVMRTADARPLALSPMGQRNVSVSRRTEIASPSIAMGGVHCLCCLYQLGYRPTYIPPSGDKRDCVQKVTLCCHSEGPVEVQWMLRQRFGIGSAGPCREEKTKTWQAHNTSSFTSRRCMIYHFGLHRYTAWFCLMANFLNVLSA